MKVRRTLKGDASLIPADSPLASADGECNELAEVLVVEGFRHRLLTKAQFLTEYVGAGREAEAMMRSMREAVNSPEVLPD